MQIVTLQALVDSCRSLRGEMNVSPAARVSALIAGDSSGVGVGALVDYLKALAKLSDVRIVTELPQSDSPVQIVDQIRIMLDIKVDPVVERERIGKDIVRHEGEIARLKPKLANAGFVDRAHEIDRNVFLHVSATDREDEERVCRADAGPFQPLGEAALPSVVIDACGQLRNVVGRCVRFESADLAKVIDGVAGVTGRAADADDEEASAALAHGRELAGHTVDGVAVDAAQNLDRFADEVSAEGHR